MRMRTVTRIAGLSLLLLFVVGLAAFPSIQAENSDTSARGNVKISLADGLPRHIEFTAVLHADGKTTGEMTFTGPTETPEQILDGEEEQPKEKASNAAPTGFFFKANFQCMVVDGSRAVMSGTITQSSNEKRVGQRVILVVEPKVKENDPTTVGKVTWGVYNTRSQQWLAQDGELENDSGVGMTWLATDAERDDDAGVPSQKSESIGCQSFPAYSFPLIKVKTGDGNLEISK